MCDFHVNILKSFKQLYGSFHTDINVENKTGCLLNAMLSIYEYITMSLVNTKDRQKREIIQNFIESYSGHLQLRHQLHAKYHDPY